MKGALLLCLLLPACAWSNPDHRPVWNAFEAHLVPEQNPAFALTLPLTAPVGVGAILADTFLVHPMQVADEAFDDAMGLWQDLPWQEHYFAQAGLAPLRAAITPVCLALSFVLRSAFDMPDAAAQQAAQALAQQQRRELLLAQLQQLASQPVANLAWPPREWHDSFAEPLAQALRTGAATTRRRLLADAVGSSAHAHINWAQALGDESAVVRFLVLRQFQQERIALPEGALAKLLADPDPAVRELADQMPVPGRD